MRRRLRIYTKIVATAFLGAALLLGLGKTLSWISYSSNVWVALAILGTIVQLLCAAELFMMLWGPELRQLARFLR